MAQAPTTIDIGTLITRREGVKGGRPCLGDTGMSVHRVAALYLDGMSAEEIQADYPEVPLGLIFAALTYYEANRAEIDAYLQEDIDAYERGLAAQGKIELD